jgi:predicted NAD/FAD-binding protein
MRIAVIGSGISGNLAARILSAAHQVDVFEASSHVGGHAHTVNTQAYGRVVSADVAFMVLNRRTYPNLCRLLAYLGVETQASEMSLSVRCLRTGLEYQGSSLNGLFAQRRNLVRAPFYRMLLDIVRFNRRAIEFCESGDERSLLGVFLSDIGVGREFREQYLIPMSAAIWSADPACLNGFPAKFILGFFRNHGLLQLEDRPQWLTIADRSRNYVTELMRPLRDRVFLNAPVRSVHRVDEGVRLSFGDREPACYDHVVLASHADQSLQLLADASESEREILSGFPYQPNTAILHTDCSVLPKRRRAWASWNYHLPNQPTHQASVTYDLNRLQSLGLPEPLCLTLNPSCEIDQRKVLQRFEFQHPVFSLESANSQRRFDEINGINGVSFCGAYWGYGFHEDGVNSALSVTRPFGLDLEVLAQRATDQRQLVSQLAGA